MPNELSYMTEDEGRKARWAHLTGKRNPKDRNDRIDQLSPRGVPEVRIVTEMMLDNMAKVLEDVVTTAAHPTFTTFAFPLVRRVLPRLLANDIFSVQPMSQPTGKVFFRNSLYTGGARRDLKANFNKAYATTGENTAVAEISLSITSADVSATKKALKAKWTIEEEQDLKAYFGLSAEPELLADVADELVREKDLDMIEDAIAQVPAGHTFTFTKATPTAGAYSTIDPKIYKRTLWDKLLEANNSIFTDRYVNATWIVAGSSASLFLEQLDEWAADPSADPAQWTAVQGAHFLGTLANRWGVYKHPWINTDTLFMGYKGPSFLHAGYVYAPYSIYTSPVLTDPEDMTSRRGMMNRGAQKMVVPEMYAKVTLV